jgi:Putative glycosyl/glycerophosphate transferases involved in teichoic acid biosynthesis TagF/TagB/EpsJ/RodC
MYARYCQAGSAHVISTGHPKLDRFSQGIMESRSGPLAKALGNRRAVLWTPHFSVEEGGWSTYLQNGETILSAFEKQDDLALIMRPHPLFFPRLRKLGLMDEEGEAAFRERLKVAGMILDESPDYAEAFACSEAMIADAGSFLLEYLPTQKPVLYLDQPLGPGLMEEGAFVQDYYQGRSQGEILAFIEMLARGEDPLKARRLALIPEYLTQLDGRSGARIAMHIIEGVQTERRQGRCRA